MQGKGQNFRPPRPLREPDHGRTAAWVSEQAPNRVRQPVIKDARLAPEQPDASGATQVGRSQSPRIVLARARPRRLGAGIGGTAANDSLSRSLAKSTAALPSGTTAPVPKNSCVTPG